MTDEKNYVKEMVIYLLKHLTSLILPVTVLILVPLAIEKDIAIKTISALVVGLLLMLAGLAIMAITIFKFITVGKGTLAPWFPTGKLLVGGLYCYVRNPMIIGVLTVLFGESIAILSLHILIWTGLFFLINQIYFLVYEEPTLEKRFGEEYRSYKSRVPRWIPSLKAYKQEKESGNNL